MRKIRAKDYFSPGSGMVNPRGPLNTGDPVLTESPAIAVPYDPPIIEGLGNIQPRTRTQEYIPPGPPGPSLIDRPKGKK